MSHHAEVNNIICYHQLETRADSTYCNFAQAYLAPLPPPCFCFIPFLLSVLIPAVADIVHVFTYEVIAPDLYDRPLTLRVLVHQHQTENTQGHV